jgi:hypothetical protein
MYQGSAWDQWLTYAWQTGFLQMLKIKVAIISNYALIYDLFNVLKSC